MKFKFDENYSIQDFEGGKIITNIKDFESFYIEEDLYNILKPATVNFIDLEELNFSEDYEKEDIIEFVFTLRDMGILIQSDNS
ncbi:hypothetical protein [Bacillus pseudomycoides]|uniref:hypothetical protein n=1 Tax=Bacillus pseudomycoides TaxID=64104 RepID=UPI000BF3CC42|nr:hypothetical protein [Bacillus pseudomycoides]PGD73695.1 hypothetical protein COM46_21695 [Bacillus pseudomycoides]